jgi:hypothetical protein
VSQPDSPKSILPKKINIRPRGFDGGEFEAEPSEGLPRIRPTGHVPTGEHHSGEKRRRRRTSSDSPHHLSEAKEQTGRSPLLVATFIGLGVLFAAGAYFGGTFFYESGLSEGMRRGLDAGTLEREEIPADGATDKVFAALLNLRSSSPDRPTTEMLTFLVLRALRDTPDANLPSFLKQGHTTIEDFAAAYVAMRLGDFGKAAGILRATEPGLPPDLFSYLMNDPTMRSFAKEPRVMGFY